MDCWLKSSFDFIENTDEMWAFSWQFNSDSQDICFSVNIYTTTLLSCAKFLQINHSHNYQTITGRKQMIAWTAVQCFACSLHGYRVFITDCFAVLGADPKFRQGDPGGPKLPKNGWKYMPPYRTAWYCQKNQQFLHLPCTATTCSVCSLFSKMQSSLLSPFAVSNAVLCQCANHLSVIDMSIFLCKLGDPVRINR